MIVYGKQPVKEALVSSHQIKRIILAREIPERERAFFLRLAGQRQIPVEISAKGKIQHYCGPVVHQGIVAIIERYRYADEQDLWNRIDHDENPLLLILDQIQDPHNLGAILRSAEIVDVTCVILPDRSSAEINSTVAKTSAGAVFHVPVHRTITLVGLLDRVREKGITIVAFAPGRSEHIYRFRLDCPLALIVGSEGRGVRKNLQKMADHTLSIPQKGRTGSLNASTSAAVILFETLRQRKFNYTGD
jgi:23S rRNA (guanosine2251-2'-O)-methyltransferase